MKIPFTRADFEPILTAINRQIFYLKKSKRYQEAEILEAKRSKFVIVFDSYEVSHE